MVTISPEERAALRIRHQRTKGCDEPHCVECYKVWCGVCFEDFPCPTARLLDALEAAEQRVAALEELRDWSPGRRTKSRVPAIAEDPVREETND